MSSRAVIQQHSSSSALHRRTPHTYTYKDTQIHAHTLIHSLTQSFARSLSHTHKFALMSSRSIFYSSAPLSPCCTHTHHIPHTHTHSHTHTHTHSHSLTHPHTHFHILTNAHWCRAGQFFTAALLFLRVAHAYATHTHNPLLPHSLTHSLTRPLLLSLSHTHTYALVSDRANSYSSTPLPPRRTRPLQHQQLLLSKRRLRKVHTKMASNCRRGHTHTYTHALSVLHKLYHAPVGCSVSACVHTHIPVRARTHTHIQTHLLPCVKIVLLNSGPRFLLIKSPFTFLHYVCFLHSRGWPRSTGCLVLRWYVVYSISFVEPRGFLFNQAFSPP